MQHISALDDSQRKDRESTRFGVRFYARAVAKEPQYGLGVDGELGDDVRVDGLGAGSWWQCCAG